MAKSSIRVRERKRRPMGVYVLTMSLERRLELGYFFATDGSTVKLAYLKPARAPTPTTNVVFDNIDIRTLNEFVCHGVKN